MKTNVSLLTLLLFIINVGINLSLYFKFTDKEDLFAQFHTVTIDQLVVIGYKLTNNPPDSLVQELYHLDKYKIISYISSKFNESDTEEIFNKKISFFGLNSSINITNELKKVNRYFKAKWAIYANNYLYKKNITKTPTIGSIAQYVNYLNNEKIDEYLTNVLKTFPSAQNVTEFEYEIMNLKVPEDKVISYLLKQRNINFLQLIAIRLEYVLYHLSEPEEKRLNCEEIDKIYKMNIDEIRSFIQNKIKNEKILQPLTSMETFLFYLENEGHTFVNYVEEINAIKDSGTLQRYSLYAEDYHRKANKKSKAFEHLTEYVTKISNEDLIEYLISEITLFPELSELKRFEDMDKRSKVSVLTSVKNILEVLTRPTLLRWAHNLKEKQIKEKRTTISDEQIEEFYNYIFFNSTSELKREIIEIVQDMQSFFKNVDDTFDIAEPDSSFKKQFLRYLYSFPQLILAKFLKRVQEYDIMRTGAERLKEDPYSLDKQANVDFLNFYFTYRNDLVSFERFNEKIDKDNDGDIYGGLSDYAYVTNNLLLKKWVYLLERYHREKNRISSLAGSINNGQINEPSISDKKDDERYNKEQYVNYIMYYAMFNPELLNTKTFDNIVGRDEFHNKIHAMNFEDLKIAARKVYQYYNVKNYLIRQFDARKLPYSFDQFVEDEANIDKIKRFIFRTSHVLSEITINKVFDEILQYGNIDDSFETIKSYLNQYSDNKEKLLSIAYKCFRYSNATVSASQRINVKLESFDNPQLMYYITQTLAVNNELMVDWNFARLIYGEEHLVYGGYMSYFIRQSLYHRKNFLKNMREKIINDTYLEDSEFEKLSNDEQVQYLSHLVDKNQQIFKSLKILEKFFSFQKMTKINLAHVKREKLIIYALICEFYVDKKKQWALYGGIHQGLYERTKEEIEDYIARTYPIIEDEIKTITDFEIYAQILGFNKKENNLVFYSL